MPLVIHIRYLQVDAEQQRALKAALLAMHRKASPEDKRVMEGAVKGVWRAQASAEAEAADAAAGKPSSSL